MDYPLNDIIEIKAPGRVLWRITPDGKLRGRLVTQAVTAMVLIGFSSGVAGALAVELLR